MTKGRYEVGPSPGLAGLGPFRQPARYLQHRPRQPTVRASGASDIIRANELFSIARTNNYRGRRFLLWRPETQRPQLRG